MRIIPKRWSTETWVCSTRGHVAPGATVATIGPDDSALVVSSGSDRLCRCLRCDAWILYRTPESGEITSQTMPAPGELPRPMRGRALDERVIVRLIALERGLHVVFFLIAILILLAVAIGLPAIKDQVDPLLQQWQNLVEDSRPSSSILVRWLNDVANLQRGHIGVLIAMFAAYAVLEGVEAFYLWRGKRWAEYLTVVATAILLPITIQALIDKVTVLRIVGLLIEVAILIYLIWTKRLFGVRGGQARLEAELESDVNWDDIIAHAPWRTPVIPTAQQLQ